jgi:hypothetical protein
VVKRSIEVVKRIGGSTDRADSTKSNSQECSPTSRTDDERAAWAKPERDEFVERS